MILNLDGGKTARAVSGDHQAHDKQGSEYASQDLGYVLWIERTRLKTIGADEMTPVSLRVTTIFRREDGDWKIIHRHGIRSRFPDPSNRS